MQQKFISGYRIAVVALAAVAFGGLLGVSPTLFALDIFGSSKTQEPSSAPISGSILTGHQECL